MRLKYINVKVRPFIYIVFFLLVNSIIFSCGKKTAAYSGMFNEILTDTTGHFCGVKLGQPYKLIAKPKGYLLKTADEMGALYEKKINPNGLVEIEFYKNAEQTTQSIVANLFLDNESEAQQLYQEFARFITEKTGIESEGSFGRFYWEAAKRPVVYELKLSGDKKALTINCSLKPTTPLE